MAVPKYHEMLLPTLTAIEHLGGSGTIQEITEEVVQILSLSESVTSQLHNPDKSSQTEVEYRLAWARTYLKKFGLIENSERGVWSFTEQYQKGMEITPEEIIQKVKKISKPANKKTNIDMPEVFLDSKDWKETIHESIISLEPSSFERLTKRILREVGFVQVEVTGKSGDGGIDGKGIVKIQDVLSYHVVFQCKRYKGSVGPGSIRDFRGAMVGRADKGLFITTGTFTREATKEATRDGASPIDLIDGDDLAELLKKLRLGVTVRLVEEVDIDKQWFEKI